jgi:hypothetical protein
MPGRNRKGNKAAQWEQIVDSSGTKPLRADELESIKNTDQ